MAKTNYGPWLLEDLYVPSFHGDHLMYIPKAGIEADRQMREALTNRTEPAERITSADIRKLHRELKAFGERQDFNLAIETMSYHIPLAQTIPFS